MKKVLTTTLLAATLVSGMACAADAAIPWADNSGGTESTHIAAMGQDYEQAASADNKDQRRGMGGEFRKHQL